MCVKNSQLLDENLHCPSLKREREDSMEEEASSAKELKLNDMSKECEKKDHGVSHL